MAQLSIQTTAIGGLVPSFASAAAGGDAFVDDGLERTFLRVKNGGGSSVTVTVAPVTPTTVAAPGVTPGPVSLPSYSVAVAASADAMIGPFPMAYRDASGNINVTYSAVTSVTVAAIKVARLS